MRAIYMLTLAIGCTATFVGLMPLIACFAPSHEAQVAAEFTQDPNQWSLSMSPEMAERLECRNEKDGKAQLVASLRTMSQKLDPQRKLTPWEGLIIMAFSIVGLLRETTINWLRSQVAAGKPKPEEGQAP